MLTPVLATKLFIPPPRASLVPRPHLIGRLDAGLAAGRRLSLISAPAGFGKTTLVASWLSERMKDEDRRMKTGQSDPSSFILHPSSFAWLSLDAGDGDLARFLAYLVAALQTAAAPVGAGLAGLLQSPQPPPTEALLTALLNDLAVLPDRVILVLDDYHTLDAPAVDRALAFLVEHLPPQLHLVLVTREDPHLSLARLRARDQLTELRASDLRFTPAEAATFLTQVMGLSLAADDIATLEARTEGWVAGLQLAALSMQGRDDSAGFLQAFAGSHRFVLDYLAEEVLGRQPEAIRSFLLHTALLDRLCAPLCNAVVGRDDGKAMLEALERSNLFLIPLDDERQWYRYHHLFAEVLQAHLMQARPDQVASLHQRASVWYEQHGLRPDAIRHALAARDVGRAAGLIELAGPAIDDRSIQPALWLGWVEALPEALVRARPVLSAWYAYALLGRGDLEAAAARFADAERWLDQTGVQLATPSAEMVVADQEQLRSLPATIAVGRAYIAQALGNLPDTLRYAHQALELAPEQALFRRAQAAMLLGMTHWASGNLQAADRVFAEYTTRLGAAGNLPDAIAVLADIRLTLGRLREAIGAVEQCLAFVMDQGEPLPLDTADLHRELSVLYLEQGNLAAAAHHIQRGKELGERAGLPILRYRLRIAQARLSAAQADPDGALALLEEAERLYIRSPLPDFCPIAAMKARIWLAQGRLRDAQGWARERNLSVDDTPSYLREFEQITLARLLIAQYGSSRTDGSLHTVMRLLDRLLQAAEAGGRMGSAIEILVLQALAYQAQGDITRALVPLERALSLAEPEGYVRIFVGEGRPMAALLEQVQAKGGALQQYAVQLLAACSGEIARPTAPSPQPCAEPLSERELHVLRLLRSDLSGPEIARELVVSLSTLRTHTQHIYAKLGVNNRRAAVHRAAELGLL
jgi:LuxR family maltose regulon positive regulatory protein